MPVMHLAATTSELRRGALISAFITPGEELPDHSFFFDRVQSDSLLISQSPLGYFAAKRALVHVTLLRFGCQILPFLGLFLFPQLFVMFLDLIVQLAIILGL